MTPFTAPLLEGDDWEKFCTEALEYRHQKTNLFQKLPARFNGDYGVDGFIRNRTIFQFYGDQAGASASDRAAGQRRKLKTDIPKLKTYAVDIGKLVGTGISEYVFLVSVCQDKGVVALAKELAAEARGWDLDYLSDAFEIQVKDIDYLKVEWDILYGDLKQKLNIEAPVHDQETEDAWRATSNELLGTLRTKLGGIVTDIDEWDSRLVRDRMGEMDRMALLRRYGSVWQRVREAHAAREDTLWTRQEAPDPRQDVLDLYESYKAELVAEVPSLRPEDVKVLAWGAIGEWLMRCPLKYGA